jgi:tripartite-type tricarboxylate transporter receptor subunit TctC
MIVRNFAAIVFGFAALGSTAHAQDWPTKPVKIITGFAAGGIGDLGARLLADHISRTTGQQAVVENRTGAAGTLGMDAVAKAAPDGTTLGLALNGNIVINPFIQKQMPFARSRTSCRSRPSATRRR